MPAIGRTVYLWRNERKLTQDQLARAAGISRPNLSDLERGKRELSLKSLRRLSSALQITPGTLVDGVSPLAVKGSTRFDRRSLDRIADAVFGKKKVTDQEGRVAELLKVLSHSRLSVAMKTKPRPIGKRRVNAAWAQFKSGLPREIGQALLQRIEDRERLRW